MRSLLIAASLLSSAFAANAQRLNSLRMTCDQARAIVASRGAVLLGSGPHVYDRYVAGSRFCEPGEVARILGADRRYAVVPGRQPLPDAGKQPSHPRALTAPRGEPPIR